MPRRVPLPSALPPYFSVRDARAAGVGYGRLRGADLVALFHGVRAPSGRAPSEKVEERIRERARQYAPRLRPGQFFCEVTALALLGVWLPPGVDDGAVHVGVVGPRRAPRARGVVGHEITTPALARAQGLPVNAGPEAWAHAATRLSVTELVLIGDGLVRRKFPLAARVELSEVVRTWCGKRGSRRLAAAEALVRAGTDSIKESELRLVILGAGLPEPDVNAELYDRRGRQIGFGDLLYRQYKVLVEYDGGYHFETDRQVKKDIDRLATLADASYTMIRVHKLHLRDPRSSLARIRAALLQAGWSEPSENAGKRTRKRTL